jgi:hypothetical protein
MEKVVREKEKRTLSKNELLKLKTDASMIHYVKDQNKDTHFYVMETKDKVLHIEREGKCEPKKCNSACCKGLHVSTDSTYWRMFGKKSATNGTIVEKTCPKLKKGLCSVWKKSNFPGACRQFPHINDDLYIQLSNVCSFKFKVIHEFKKQKEK